MAPMRILYLLYFWLLFAPILLLATTLFGALALLLAPLLGPRKTARLTAVPWARFNLAATGVKVQVIGAEHINPKQSYVLVANHLSHYDIWALYGWLGVDFRWVAKQEVRRIPIIGIACVALGHVFIDRRNRDSAIESLNQARDQISHGTSIMFFPEGTRSRDGSLMEFKKGAFVMARDLQLPVLPITITGAWEVLPADTLLVTPGTITLTIHAPLDAASQNDIELMMRTSRAAIASSLPAQSLPT